MIFGIPPFYSKNHSLMFERIKNAEIKFPDKPKGTDEVKDIIIRLLIKEPTKRMGSQKDVEEIKNHPWFKGFDWEGMLNRKLKAPFLPKVGGEDWVKNFDEEFTSESTYFIRY